MLRSRKKNEQTQFLDPAVISRLGNMELRARLIVEGYIAGMHRSPYHGFSVEFAEYRQYMQGDNIKDFDWKAYGKTDRLVQQHVLRARLKLNLSTGNYQVLMLEQ